MKQLNNVNVCTELHSVCHLVVAQRVLHSHVSPCCGATRLAQSQVFSNIFRCLSSSLSTCNAYMYSICTVHVQYTYSTCTVNVQCMYSTCTVYVQYMYSKCTVYVQYMYSKCTVYVQYMYSICTVHVQ